jgi:endonuclease/exonuclease/phosphatase family metal-dependent hydrolase
MSLVRLVVCALLLWPALAAGQELRVMSFNIRYDNPLDGENAWPKRRELAFATIEKFAPDLLGLQEVQHGQAKAFAARMKGYEMHGVARDDHPRSERSSILFKRERFEKVRGGDFWLSETPDAAGSKGWDADLPRIVSWVELRDRDAGGRTVFFFNTHWDHRGAEARAQSAKLMRSRVADIAGDKPVIITGDFNTPQESGPYKTMLGGGFFDAFPEVHQQPTRDDYTFHGFTGTSNRGHSRIDWVLRSRHFRTVDAGIDRTNDHGRYPSDHFPVYAVFEWPEENK